MNYAPVIRIAIRYIAGFLIARGMTGTDYSYLALDPDVITAVGLGIGAISESWYFLARKYGWMK